MPKMSNIHHFNFNFIHPKIFAIFIAGNFTIISELFFKFEVPIYYSGNNSSIFCKSLSNIMSVIPLVR